MWALAFLALTALLFLLGAAVGVVWFLARRKRGVAQVMAAVAMPFGFAAIPLIGLVAVTLVASAFQKNDLQLYQELFGRGTTVPMQSMLFDEFGRGRSREIYMRISPDDPERAFLESLPGLRASQMTLDQFVARGDRHGFMWWISSDPNALDRCPSARILEADGFNGWREFRIADCEPGQVNPEGPDRGPIYVNGPVYVIAVGRED